MWTRTFITLVLLGSAAAELPARPQFEPDGLVKIGDGTGGFNGDLSRGDRFGRAVAPLGDIDGDGIGDIAICAKRDDDGGTDTGSIFIVALNRDGTVKWQSKISNGNGGIPHGTLSDLDYFGYSLAALSDLNGDGIPELAVGAPGDDTGGADTGAMYILFLNSSGVATRWKKLSAQSGIPNPPSQGDAFGQAASPAGDWDGDGIDDLLIASPQADDGARDAGAIELCLLQADGSIREQRRISATEGGFGNGLDARDSFGGRGLIVLDDVDGDLVRDIAVGAFRDDDGGADAGAIWIIQLNRDFTVKSKSKISATNGGLAHPPKAGDNFGHSLAHVGDWDGNGVPDLATGANGDDAGAADAGSFSILLLNRDSTVRHQYYLNADNGAFPGVTIPGGDRFSRTVGFLGDHRKNGTKTIAIGAGAGTTGHVWILHFDDFGLWSSDLVAGSTGTLHLASATPGSRAVFAWSISGGGPTTSPWGDLSLTEPIEIAGDSKVSPAGLATYSTTVPSSAKGTTVWIQAAEVQSGSVRLSNGTARIVE